MSLSGSAMGGAAGSATVAMQPAPEAAAPVNQGAAGMGERGLRALIISVPVYDAKMQEALGSEAYSYYFVYRAYKPMLEKWAEVVEVQRAESQVNFAFRKAGARGARAYHLAFFPPHLTYLSPDGPTAGVVAWEFSTIPDSGFGNNLRNNWLQVLNQMQFVITLCEFSRAVLVAAGVKTPVMVLPPPVAPRYFGVGAWKAGAVTEMGCGAYELISPGGEAAGGGEAAPGVAGRRGLRKMYARGKKFYYKFCHPLVPPALNALALRVAHKMKHQVEAAGPSVEIAGATLLEHLRLSGVVYTTILSVFDGRKNWTDILTAFLKAFADTADATLVLKIVALAHLREQALRGVVGFHQALGMGHRCRVVLVATYLSNEQMVQLTEATTYYVNASRAEGLCMPLQDYLAAGRPAVAPRHTAMLDYFDETMGFVVRSSAEPTHWPHDPRRYNTTTWQRIDWESLHDQLRASHELVRARPEGYRQMAAAARARMEAYAGAEAVEPQVRRTLEALAEAGRKWKAAAV